MNLVSPDCMALLYASLCASLGAVWDVRTRRIPNHLTGSMIVLGLLLHLSVGGWQTMGLAVAAGLVGGAVFFFFFIAGGMGAGDVKLMAAVCCIAGFGHLEELFLATVLTGGMFALVLALARGRLKATVRNVGILIEHHATAGAMPHPELNIQNPAALRLPYGVAVAAGCWITLLMQAGMR